MLQYTQYPATISLNTDWISWSVPEKYTSLYAIQNTNMNNVIRTYLRVHHAN